MHAGYGTRQAETGGGFEKNRYEFARGRNEETLTRSSEYNFVTAVVPSETACLASSPGRIRRTAVWISRDDEGGSCRRRADRLDGDALEGAVDERHDRHGLRRDAAASEVHLLEHLVDVRRYGLRALLRLLLPLGLLRRRRLLGGRLLGGRHLCRAGKQAALPSEEWSTLIAAGDAHPRRRRRDLPPLAGIAPLFAPRAANRRAMTPRPRMTTARTPLNSGMTSRPTRTSSTRTTTTTTAGTSTRRRARAQVPQHRCGQFRVQADARLWEGEPSARARTSTASTSASRTPRSISSNLTFRARPRNFEEEVARPQP